MTDTVRRFVDANLVIRYLTDKPPEQADVAELILGGGRLLMNGVILLECSYVLTKGYGFGRAETADALMGLLGWENIDTTDMPKDLALEALLSARDQPGLSFGDALIIASMRATGVDEIYSFDRRFKAEGITVRTEPA